MHSREKTNSFDCFILGKYEIHPDIDVHLKYHDARLALDVIEEQRYADNNPTPADRASYSYTLDS